VFDKIKAAFEGVWTSLVRTYTPWIVGLIVGFLVNLGIALDPELELALTALITTLAGALWYLIARVLERIKPAFGLMLGSTKKPVYAVPEAVPAVEHTATLANAAAKNKE
jgi:hypothetical protein